MAVTGCGNEVDRLRSAEAGFDLHLVKPVDPALLIGVLIVGALGTTALRWPAGRPMPHPVAVCGFVVAVNLAALLAWSKALRGERNPIWEPTRRPDIAGASGAP